MIGDPSEAVRTPAGTGTADPAPFGVPAAALAVYRALLHAPDRPVQRAAADAGFSAAELDAALADLRARDLVQDVGGVVRVVAPHVGLRSAVLRAEDELRAHEARVVELRTEAEALVEEYQRAREERLTQQVEVLTTPADIISAIEAEGHAARSELLTFATHKPSPEEAGEAREQDEQALDRGMSIRILYREGQVDRTWLPSARWYVERGTQIRLAPTLPLRMLVWDRSVALTALDPADPSAGAVVVRTPGVVAALVALFEAYWERARSPFDEEVPAEPGDLSLLERNTLTLLAQGDKDEAVARKLGVSVRTVRKAVSDLSAATGATSRFELALRARERGWV